MKVASETVARAGGQASAVGAEASAEAEAVAVVGEEPLHPVWELRGRPQLFSASLSISCLARFVTCIVLCCQSLSCPSRQ